MLSLPFLLLKLALLFSLGFTQLIRPLQPLQLVQPVQAQFIPTTGPIQHVTTVTATVPDNIPPTTPVLVSPADGSYVTSGKVTFVWHGSSDANGIDHYELSLDGSGYLNVPTTGAEDNNYLLTYDADEDRYALQVKNSIPDGSHTWKIRAIDTLYNGTDSVTWSFILDTQAPSFVLTQVGGVTTSISAQDIKTVPTQPLILTKNSPQLLGHGEADSTVLLTITIPGDPSQTFTHSTDTNGNWGELLSILPRDVIMYLDFTITDQAGHISLLNDIPFTIPTQYFTFPPNLPPSLPPSSSTPTPNTPPVGEVILPTPTTPPTPALITIPLTPAIEIAHEILQESAENMPAPIRRIIETIPPKTRAEIAVLTLRLTPFLLLVIELIGGIMALLSILHRFGKQVTPDLIWKAWQKLQLFPTGKAWFIFNQSQAPQGMVFDSLTHQGVSFAQVEVRTKQGTPVGQVLTDQDGFFQGIALKPGEYQLWVSQPQYQFPSQQDRPSNLDTTTYYQGENFVVGDFSKVGDVSRIDDIGKVGDVSKVGEKIIPLRWLIPVDLAAKTPPKQWPWFISLSGFKSLHSHLFWPFVLLDFIIVLIFPSSWNIAVLATYLYQVGWEIAAWFQKPILAGYAKDSTPQPSDLKS